MRIDLFQSHIEISPYKKGECFLLEKSLSKWVKTYGTHGRYEAIGYFILDDTLFIPRGTNIEALESAFGTLATKHPCSMRGSYMSQKYSVKFPPRNKVQEQSVYFLTHSNGYAQSCLNLNTSSGKTYCAINAFTQIGKKTLIIVNREYLANHWKSEILKFTDIPEERVMILDSVKLGQVIEAEKEADVYIILHQSLQSYVRSNDFIDIKEFMQIAGIGVKVYDEAHEFMQSIFMIDCFTEVENTWYLTATAARTDSQENKVFKTILAAAHRFNEGVDESDRKVHYFRYWYDGGCKTQTVAGMMTGHGFSKHKFIEHAMKDENRRLDRAFLKVLEQAICHDGQILVVVPKIDSVDYYAELAKQFAQNDMSVSKIYSKKTSERINSFDAQRADIIISTMESCGTGFNPPNLQTVICMEPHTSRVQTQQLKGRTDRYHGEDTYFYDLLDMSIPYMQKVKYSHEMSLRDFIKEIQDVQI